jgi:hypothetical protein
MTSTNKKIVFSDNEKELLIECYQARPILWDCTNPDYEKRDKRGLELGAITREMSDAFNKQYTGLLFKI